MQGMQEMDSVSGPGRSHGEGHGNPFQYYIENSTDREVWQATVPGIANSPMQLSTQAHTHEGSSSFNFLLTCYHQSFQLQPQQCGLSLCCGFKCCFLIANIKYFLNFLVFHPFLDILFANIFSLSEAGFFLFPFIDAKPFESEEVQFIILFFNGLFDFAYRTLRPTQEPKDFLLFTA